MKRRYRNRDADDFEIVNGKPILRDGHIYRTHLRMMDARSVGDSGPMKISTLDGKSGVALNRPGWRCLLEDDAGAQAKQRAYDAYRRDLENSYKRPVGMGSVPGVETGQGEGSPRGSVSVPDPLGPYGLYPFTPEAVGAACTIDGRPGRLKRKGNWLICTPLDDDADADDADDTEKATSDARTVAQQTRDHQNRMDRIYSAIDADLEQQWRNGK
jgi:hypothetical protein